MRLFASPAIMFDRVSFMTAIALYVAAMAWVLYVALEPYVRRFWPQLLIGWTRLLSGHSRDPLVGRDVLVGVAAGMVAGLLIASRELVPWLLGLPLATPAVPEPLILLGTRHTVSLALQTVRRALIDTMEIVGVVVFLRIVVRRTWIVLLLSGLMIVPLAISGTFAVEQLAIELVIVAAGIALMLVVLLRFGLLSLVVTFYTFLSIENFPLTIDLSRPYAGASFVLLGAVAGLAIWGFVASRGTEPLFGRTLLD
jgi:serine/threonine-protein kinase